MFKNQTNAPSVKQSNGVQEQSKTFDFVREHQGSLSFRKLEFGAYLCEFSSSVTGHKAFAWGGSIQKSYENMIRNFTEKYLVA